MRRFPASGTSLVRSLDTSAAVDGSTPLADDEDALGVLGIILVVILVLILFGFIGFSIR